MTRRTILLSLLLAVFPTLIPAQTEKRWDTLTRHEIGVDRFLASHPDLDGKGVVIAVLDTGVDMGVEGLKALPDGKVKVVDCRDFSAEGDLYWEEARRLPESAGEKLVDSKGRSLRGFRKVTKGAAQERFFLAFLEEKMFLDTRVKDLNGDGDSKDVFGILIFTVNDGKTFRYEAVVDVNGDGSLEDGIRVTDYWRQHQTFVLTGKKGSRRQLTMACNFYPAEKRISIHFDSGGHGTHVAGIAAGYRIHGQDGYNGMAPGAQIISLKIGNNRYPGGATITESVKKALDYGARYAREHKVPVVYNMSFGIGSERESRSSIEKYVDELLWKNPGVVFVTSAGNKGPGLSSVGTPSAAKRAIAVGAMLSPAAAAAQYGCSLEKEVPFVFSSRGGDTYKPDIMAPGSAASTVPLWGDRDHMHGTSMASPAAAGAIALLVDGLVRHDPPFKVDNALVLRAVKNTGRHLPGLTFLDEGGGALDLPAAYAHARFLASKGEAGKLREYRILNQGPAAGVGVAYWRRSPMLPRKTEAMNFQIKAGFPAKISKEGRARFYRAFDLKPDKPWLSLTRPLIYLKGNHPAKVGVMADLADRGPGLYTGKIRAYRKSEDRVAGAPVHEFDLVVSILVPHRVTPGNRGLIRVGGTVKPGFQDRFFVEVPPGTGAITLDLRMLEGGRASGLTARLYDPDGVRRLIAGPVADPGTLNAHATLTGADVVPGTWEIVAVSSIRSRETARYDLNVKLNGVQIGKPTFFARTADPLRDRLLVPVHCTQAVTFRGSVKGRLDRFVKKQVIELKDTIIYRKRLCLDSMTRTARWTFNFNRDTYALLTDCVIQVVDVKTGKTLRNVGMGKRSASTSIPIPENLAEGKEYELVLIPAFSLEKDSGSWQFTLTEELLWRTQPLEMKVVRPQGGTLSLMPWDWAEVELRLGVRPPSPPHGYINGGTVEVVSSEDGDIRFRKSIRL